MIKYLMINFLLFNLIFAEITIKIYNNGHALIQEQRSNNFSSIGNQTLTITNFPISVISSSINIISKDITPISKQYFYKPVSIKNLLDSNIGNEIDLVVYGENGNIVFSTIGKLISNNISPVFEIDKKIVIDPPYKYQFKNIPPDVLDHPYVIYSIENFKNKTKYNLSYLVKNINWNAEFDVFINEMDKAKIKGWYYIKNDNKIVYKNSEISLVSGTINFEQKGSRAYNNQRLAAKIASPSFSSKNTEEYTIYNIPEKIDLNSNTEIGYNFISNDEVTYKRIYFIEHSLFRSRSIENDIDIPVNIRYDLIADDISDIQLPKATYNLFEKENDDIIFIGSSKFDIVGEKDKIKLNTGKTNEVLCAFTIKEVKMDKKKIILNASFKNRKNKEVSIEWIQNTPDIRINEENWQIIDSDLFFTKIDYNSNLFEFKIPAKSTKIVSLTISTGK